MSPKIGLAAVLLLVLSPAVLKSATQPITRFFQIDQVPPTKTSANEAIQYVSPHGKDSNDGLSWGTAKLTVMAAYDGLPSRGGTVYVTDGVTANSVSGAGIWIMGSTDPQYSHPPRGWRQMKPGSVSFIGIPKDNYGPNAHMGRALMGDCCSPADVNHPGIWISGVNTPLYFSNLNIGAAGRGIVIGEDSNHNRLYGTGSSSGLTFYNVTSNPTATPGLGPPWDITGGSFWIWMEHCGGTGLDQVNTPTANNAAAVLLDGSGSNHSVGLVYIEDFNASSGGIKYISGSVGSGSLAVRRLNTEGQHSPAAVWFVPNASGAQVNYALVEDVNVADSIGTRCNGTVCVVENDGAGPAENIVVADVSTSGAPLKGPMMVLGAAFGLGGNDSNVKASFFRSGFRGVIGNKLIGTTDAARRGFPPTDVRFANLAFTAPSSWTLTGTGPKLRIGIDAPDGTTGAGRLSSTGPGGAAFYFGNQTVSVGDWLIGGAWYRSNSGNGYSRGSPLQIGVSGCTLSLSYGDPTYSAPYFGDGEWEWGYNAIKVASVSNRACTLQWTGFTDSKHVSDFYGPVFFRIPAGTVSDNEALEIASNLQSYNSSCAVGTICGLPGQTLSQTFLIPDNGTPFTNANLTLSTGWGDKAAVTAARGSAQRFTFTAMANGGGITTNPKMTVAFPNAWPVTPIFSCKQVGGTGALTIISGENTVNKTTMILTFNGTPALGSTYIFVCEGE
jgi:hypothetical protein